MIDLDNDLIHPLTYFCLPSVLYVICDCCIHAFIRIMTFITRKFQGTEVLFANTFRPWIMDEGTLRSTISDVLI